LRWLERFIEERLPPLTEVALAASALAASALAASALATTLVTVPGEVIYRDQW
jgi:hypothetical protein